MNHVYRVVWNVANGVWQVAAESTRSNGKSKSKRQRRPVMAALGAGSALLLSHSLLAAELPGGGSVVAGSAGIETHGGSMTINQSSQNVAIDWQSFSIGQDGNVTFLQPNAEAAALNRVTGDQVSQIRGSLSANGRVFLVNPNGVMFSSTAQVDVGSLVASTLDIATQDFMDGNYSFAGGSGNAVINQGNITAADGGFVAMIAAEIINTGSITANQGAVLMGAGNRVTLDLGGPIKIEVEEALLETHIEQGGAIRADGGLVFLTAKAANAMTSSVINHTGITQAQTLASNEAGEIWLMGDMQRGEVQVAGTLDASAPDAGDGGFIETSAAKVTIDDKVNITTDADSGITGEWLIDPVDFTVAQSGGDITGDALSSLIKINNVTLQTIAGTDTSTEQFGEQGTDGDIFVNDRVAWSNNRLTLNAHRNIEINRELFASGSGQLRLEYGQGAVAAGNNASYSVNAPVNLPAGNNFSTRLGSDGALQTYRVLTQLGTQGSTTATDLQGINGNRGGRYVLGADIDASATSSWSAGEGFGPIGNFSNPFTGVFDGLGHEVNGLTINRPTATEQGLFGVAENASIRNIGLTNVNIRGQLAVGALAGLTTGSSTLVDNSYATGRVRGRGLVGGLVGQSAGLMSNSYTDVAVDGENEQIGGLIGNNLQGTAVSNSYATGSVRGRDQIGGLIGFSRNAFLINSYATGNVTGFTRVGGLIGFTLQTLDAAGNIVSNSYATGNVRGTNVVGGLIGSATRGTVIQSYATGSVSGNGFVGGLVGDMVVSGTVRDSYATGNVESRSGSSNTVGGLLGSSAADVFNSYSTGSVTGDQFNQNGLVGFYRSGTVRNNFWDTNTSGQRGSSVGFGRTTSQMMRLSNFVDAGWDIQLDPALSNIYPFLAFQDDGSGGYTSTWVIGTSMLVLNLPDIGLNGSLVYSGQQFDLSDYWTPDLMFGDEFAGLVAGEDFRFLANGNEVTGFTNASTYESISVESLNTQNLSFTGDNSASFTISPASINFIEDILAFSKVYDGTLQLRLDIGDARFDGVLGDDSLSVEGASGLFADKNVGNGKQVNISGLSLGGVDAGNYVLADSTATTTASIIPAVINFVDAIDAISRAYNGTLDVDLDASAAQFDGVIAGDDLNVADATGQFADKNVGNGKQVSISGITLGGTDAGNYLLANNSATTTADINAATINSVGAILAASRVYDGTTDAQLDTSGAQFDGIVAGDDLSVTSAVGQFADKNVGGGKQVNISGITLGGTDAGNYLLANNSATTTADINAATINFVGAILAASRVYDGTTDAQLDTSGAQFDGIVVGDDLNVADAIGQFADKNVGDNKQVSISDITLGGADAGNYVLADSTATTTADINPATINFVGAITAASRVYNASTDAQLDTSDAQFDGMVSGDDLSVTSATGEFADKNAGNGKQVSISGITLGGTDADNYLLANNSATTTADINAATINFVGAILAASRVYDGTTDAQLDTSGAQFDGKVSGDDLSVASATGQFADKNVGNGKQVTINGLSLGGADAGNYVLADSNANTSADINPATINFVEAITAASRVYNASADAQLDTSGAQFDGIVSGDDLNVASAVGKFSDKNVGDGKQVSISDITLSGGDVGNYVLAENSAMTTADINPATINFVEAILAASRVYDGTTDAQLDTSGAQFDGIVSGDDLSVTSATGEFADKNVGDGKQVSISGIVLGGTDAGNYLLASNSATTTADINPATINFVEGILAASKVYDGTTDAQLDTLGAQFDGIVSGDDLSVTSAIGEFADKNVADGKQVSISDITLSGVDVGNYVLADSTATTTANITPATINFVEAILAASRVYDGTTDAQLNTNGAQFDGIVAGDELNVASAIGQFADKNVGDGKQVAISGLSLGGADAGNYALADSTATTSADINPATINFVEAILAASRVYDGTRAAELNTSGAQFDGIVTGDDLNVASAFGEFGDKNVADGKQVSISDITLSGVDAGNYVLADTTATTTANITPATINFVDAILAASRAYDGTTDAQLDASGARFDGMVAGDDLIATNAIGTFADANADNGKQVSIEGIALGGVDTGNYILADTTASTTADILRREVAVAADSQIKIRGEVDPALTFDVERQNANRGLLMGESLTGELERNAGEASGNYAITQGSLVNANNSNYDVQFTGNELVIVPANSDALGAAVSYSEQLYRKPPSGVGGPPSGSGLNFVSVQSEEEIGEAGNGNSGQTPFFLVNGGIKLSR